jgi:hypothetical protein
LAPGAVRFVARALQPMLGYQASGLETLIYFKDDVIITMTYGQIERFFFGVPDSLKEEIKARPTPR